LEVNCRGLFQSTVPLTLIIDKANGINGDRMYDILVYGIICGVGKSEAYIMTQDFIYIYISLILSSPVI
jgi:hypothetical protein